jgi:hypothetical protein
MASWAYRELYLNRVSIRRERGKETWGTEDLLWGGVRKT